jgi:hypothetical protein
MPQSTCLQFTSGALPGLIIQNNCKYTCNGILGADCLVSWVRARFLSEDMFLWTRTGFLGRHGVSFAKRSVSAICEDGCSGVRVSIIGMDVVGES